MRNIRIRNKYRLKLKTTFRESVGSCKNCGEFKTPERNRILKNRYNRYVMPNFKV